MRRCRFVTDQAGPNAALVWSPLDPASAVPQRLLVRDTLFTGSAPAIDLPVPATSVELDNILKLGPGPLLQVGSNGPGAASPATVSATSRCGMRERSSAVPIPQPLNVSSTSHSPTASSIRPGPRLCWSSTPRRCPMTGSASSGSREKDRSSVPTPSSPAAEIPPASRSWPPISSRSKVCSWRTSPLQAPILSDRRIRVSKETWVIAAPCGRLASIRSGYPGRRLIPTMGPMSPPRGPLHDQHDDVSSRHAGHHQHR